MPWNLGVPFVAENLGPDVEASRCRRQRGGGWAPQGGGRSRHSPHCRRNLVPRPVYIREEVSRHAGMISDRSKVPLETVLAVLEDLLSAIELIPSAAYASSILDARRLARTAAAQGDEDYIALSLAFDAPAWTLDRDIARVPGLRVLSTRDVGRL